MGIQPNTRHRRYIRNLSRRQHELRHPHKSSSRLEYRRWWEPPRRFCYFPRIRSREPPIPVGLHRLRVLTSTDHLTDLGVVSAIV